MSWSEVRERYTVGFLKRNPITATYLGGDGYAAELSEVNATLPDVSSAGTAEAIGFYRSVLADLERVNADLPAADRIDRDVVRAQVTFLLHMLVDLRYQQRSLDTYTVAAFRGVDWQIQQMEEGESGTRGTEAEWDRVARRVAAIPAFLRDVEAVLREGIAAGNVPDARMIRFDGIDTCKDNAEYFSATLPGQAAGYLGARPFAGRTVGRLRDAGRAAADAFAAFETFLKEAYPSGGGDRFACGAAEYDWRLRNNLRLAPSDTAASLYDYAQARVEETQRALIDVAREVAARRHLRLDWHDRAASLRSTRAVMDDLGRDSPKNDEEMFRIYRDEAQNLVEYARVHDMFDLPAEYRLEIVPTPPILEATLEAAYYPAPAFKAAGIGRFYLTASHGKVGVLKENNVHAVADLCAHEGFPGHDWQYQFMRGRVRSIGSVRWLTPGAVEDSSSMWEDSMSSEGWALYAEELVGEPQPGAETGFYTPEERIYQLKWQALRDARVHLDTGLHTGRLGFDEAVAYYLENVELLPDACSAGSADPVKSAACDSARRAIYRYSKWPTQAITYHLGKRDILDLRAALKARLGERFSLRDFHERFLAEGTIPAGYFRESFLNEAAATR